jgi:hypothetical protein
VPEDEIDTFVTARAEAEGVAGWELEALDSLVDPTVGIFVERDGARLVYVNGQHRAQAMLDAGVRRTLTVEYWEETADLVVPTPRCESAHRIRPRTGLGMLRRRSHRPSCRRRPQRSLPPGHFVAWDGVAG